MPSQDKDRHDHHRHGEEHEPRPEDAPRSTRTHHDKYSEEQESEQATPVSPEE